MKQLIFTLFLISTTLLYGYSDSDMDGVEDEYDQCPNTPLTELVDLRGCTTKTLISPHHFDIIVGMSYAASDYQTLNATDTLSSTLQLDYYYKNYSLQLNSSYFTTDESSYSEDGLNDTYLGGAYQKSLSKDLFLRVSAGVLLPTYDTALNNNNSDYTAAINGSYSVGDFDLFAGLSYTMINDDDTVIVYDDNSTEQLSYQNTLSYNAGLGYYASRSLYMSLSYAQSDSIYKNVDAIVSATLYGYYSFDENWFTTLSYSYGLSTSASDHYLSMKLGYFF